MRMVSKGETENIIPTLTRTVDPVTNTNGLTIMHILLGPLPKPRVRVCLES
jgi:hypothetical protein